MVTLGETKDTIMRRRTFCQSAAALGAAAMLPGCEALGIKDPTRVLDWRIRSIRIAKRNSRGINPTDEPYFILLPFRAFAGTRGSAEMTVHPFASNRGWSGGMEEGTSKTVPEARGHIRFERVNLLETVGVIAISMEWDGSSEGVVGNVAETLRANVEQYVEDSISTTRRASSESFAEHNARAQQAFVDKIGGNQALDLRDLLGTFGSEIRRPDVLIGANMFVFSHVPDTEGGLLLDSDNRPIGMTGELRSLIKRTYTADVKATKGVYKLDIEATVSELS